MRTLAAVDIGTNTIKFSLARCSPDGGIQELADLAETVRLGYRLEETGEIEPARIDAAIAALQTFERIAHVHEAQGCIGVATEAVRVATNGDDLLRRVANETSWCIRTIDGDEEARLTFIGSRDRLPGDGNVLLLDIGGGSMECLEVRDGALARASSIPLGSGRVADRWFAHEPPTREEMDAALNAVAAALLEQQPLCEMGERRWDILALSGGNGQFLQQLGGLLLGHDEFTSGAVEALYERLQVVPTAEVAELLGIAEARARVIPGGAVIARAMIEMMAPERLRAVPSGIRFGLLRERC